jgi:hypothetical protein
VAITTGSIQDRVAMQGYDAERFQEASGIVWESSRQVAANVQIWGAVFSRIAPS